DLRVERPPLVRPDVERDADLGELCLHRLGEAPSRGLTRRLVDEAEARRGAVGIGPAGAIEEPARAPRVVARAAHRCICPVVRCEEPGRGTRAAPENGCDELVAIDRERDGAPDAT